MLVAAVDVERLNAAQVHEGSVRNAILIAPGHEERVDATQVHKGRICDLSAVSQAYSVKPRVASNVNEIPIEQVAAKRHIDARWENRAPRRDAAHDPCICIHPREVHHSLTKFYTDTPQRV